MEKNLKESDKLSGYRILKIAGVMGLVVSSCLISNESFEGQNVDLKQSTDIESNQNTRISPGDTNQKFWEPLPFGQTELTEQNKLQLEQPTEMEKKINNFGQWVEAVQDQELADGFDRVVLMKAIGKCESGNEPTTNTGNGYYGEFQFLQSTWETAGGTKFAPRADLATADEQLQIALDWQAEAGWDQWPACSAELGLKDKNKWTMDDT